MNIKNNSVTLVQIDPKVNAGRKEFGFYTPMHSLQPKLCMRDTSEQKERVGAHPQTFLSVWREWKFCRKALQLTYLTVSLLQTDNKMKQTQSCCAHTLRDKLDYHTKWPWVTQGGDWVAFINTAHRCHFLSFWNKTFVQSGLLLTQN